jgi:hypothetical protein
MRFSRQTWPTLLLFRAELMWTTTEKMHARNGRVILELVRGSRTRVQRVAVAKSGFDTQAEPGGNVSRLVTRDFFESASICQSYFSQVVFPMKRARDAASGPLVPTVREPFVKRPVAAEVVRSIQLLVIKLVFGEEHVNTDRYFGKGKDELPGPLAVPVSRRHLPLLRAVDYMACEKSDGERAMLLLVGAGGTVGIPGRFNIPPGGYLIGRDFNAESIEGGEVYASLCCGGAAGGSILADGELILRPDDAGSGTAATAVFMAFDIIRAGRDDVGRSPLDARLRAIADKLRLPCRDEDDKRARAGAAGLPLLVLGKNFVPKAKVGMRVRVVGPSPTYPL